MTTNKGARPRDREELVLRPTKPPQPDHDALLAPALGLYIERRLSLSVPFPRSSRGVTVQRDNGTRVRLEDVEVTGDGCDCAEDRMPGDPARAAA